MTIKFSGDINVQSVDIHSKNGSIDVSKQLRSIDIIESIWYPFTTCVAIIEDASDVMSGLNLVGEEVLAIGASTPTETDKSKQLNFAFHIYSITDVTKSSDRGMMYKVHCISMEALVNSNRKFSKGFDDGISNIVKTLITDEKYGLSAKKSAIIEETSNAIQYTSNYWSPVKNIDFLCKRAVSKDTKTPSFVFFENRDGFNFVSLQRLFKNEPIAEFTKDNTASSSPTAGAYARIIDLEVNTLFDYYKNSSGGVYSSTIHTFDVILKQFYTKEYSPFVDPNNKPMNDISVQEYSVTTDPSSKHFVTASAYKTFDNIQDVSNTETIQAHIAMLGTSKFHNIRIKVNGMSRYTVGYPVVIHIPKTDSNESQMLSGKYIIAEASHSITGAEHTTVLSLIKDSIKK